MTDMTRVGIVDDDFLVRTALSGLIDAQSDLTTTWTAESAEAALQFLSESTPLPHVALVDLQMPGIGGIELCRRIRADWPAVSVLLITTLEVESNLGDALAAGASGFLVKDEAPGTLAQAVRSTRAGAGVFSPRATQLIGERYAATIESHPPARPSRTGPSPLTKRETEVLELVAKSMTNHQISRELNVSEATVKTHISAIIVKLDCVDRVGMVTWAFRQGIVT